MFEMGITRPSDFYWLRAIKFYTREEGHTMKTLSATMIYGYEFLGAFQRLVITPLTERCSLTIAMAFQNKFVANPAGPAGTGKTECCKDMARLLGRQCIIFNCSESNDFKVLEKIFIG